MAIPFGIFKSNSTEIEGVAGVDLYTQEDHQTSVTVTKYQIETGESASAHAFINPQIITLQGWVSDLDVIGGVISLPGAGSRSSEAWNRLKNIVKDRETHRIVTRLSVYEDMILTELTATVNKDTGIALGFTIKAEQVLIGETLLTTLPNVSGDALNKGGTVDNGLAQAESTSSSVLRQAFDGIKGLL
jgi:hypothetical protein